MTPEELREEARQAEFLARLVSYGRDKEWLAAKAAELRRQADLQQHRERPPVNGRGARPRR